MNILEIMEQRHSVRQYLKKPIPKPVRDELDAFVKEINAQSGLNAQVIYDESLCFSSPMAKYGKFENVDNYIAMVGKKSDGIEEKCGYYGEKIVLKAQELGLNTCWAALTHGKTKSKVSDGEKEVIVISLGYGVNGGKTRKSKSVEEVSNADNNSPEWFINGVKCALLAPTAINQQKFYFTLNGNTVSAKSGKLGPCLKIDLGIVKCHFELGAGKDNFKWE